MKKSDILFISAIFLAVLSIVFSASIGQVKMTRENEPLNSLSKFWMDMYGLKVTENLPQSIKYLRIIGQNNRHPTIIEINNNKQANLFSRQPQSFTYQVNNNTLFLYPKKKYTYIDLNLPKALEKITLCYGNACIVTQQDSLAIDVQNGSHLSLGESRYRLLNKAQHINHLKLQITDRSTVSLGRLKLKTTQADLENAVLKYDANVEADSLRVTLKNRSTVTSQNRNVVNQINNLVVSGDKQYFKQEFAGKDVNVMILPPQ